MYGIVQNNTVHFRSFDLIFLLCPLLHGVVTPDSVILSQVSTHCDKNKDGQPSINNVLNRCDRGTCSFRTVSPDMLLLHEC